MPTDTRDLPPSIRDLPLFRDRPHPPAPRKPTIDESFWAFHAANPWVYDHLVRMTRRLVAQGHRRVGIGMLFEVLRYKALRRTIDPTSDFQLNNNLRSRYARLLMKQEPGLADVFETRDLRAR